MGNLRTLLIFVLLAPACHAGAGEVPATAAQPMSPAGIGCWVTANFETWASVGETPDRNSGRRHSESSADTGGMAGASRPSTVNSSTST